MPAEQPTDMFCVSNQQGKRFMILLSCGACVFILAATQLNCTTLCMTGKLARARAAWYETCKQQNCLLSASCALLPLYSNMLLLACTVVADHVLSKALSQETCDTEQFENDTTAEKSRIRIWAAWRLQCVQVVVSRVRSALSTD
eukprot:3804075-Amphidinium_carterae.1